MPKLDDLIADLTRLESRNRLRALAPRRGVDFASNDYLALSGSPRLSDAIREAMARGVPIGSGGSRLLRGNDPEHELLEQEAARFFGSEAALFFASGYAANATLISTVPQRGDLIVHDELIHASAHEGMRLARAERRMAAHNDANAFADAIADWRRSGGTGRTWLLVESLYSMDGDRAPLHDLLAVAQAQNGVLVIDEAHATGVFGRDGRGLADGLDGRPDVVVLRTCGKALGVEGALLCLPRIMRDFIVNRGRGFIFTTAPSPLIAAAVREALRCLADEPERRARLHALVAHAERVLAPHGVAPTGSQILPLILGGDGVALAAAARLQQAGFDIRAIRPPTVPAGTARLRISLTLNATMQDIDRLAELLEQVPA